MIQVNEPEVKEQRMDWTVIETGKEHNLKEILAEQLTNLTLQTNIRASHLLIFSGYFREKNFIMMLASCKIFNYRIYIPRDPNSRT